MLVSSWNARQWIFSTSHMWWSLKIKMNESVAFKITFINLLAFSKNCPVKTYTISSHLRCHRLKQNQFHIGRGVKTTVRTLFSSLARTFTGSMQLMNSTTSLFPTDDHSNFCLFARSVESTSLSSSSERICTSGSWSLRSRDTVASFSSPSEEVPSEQFDESFGGATSFTKSQSSSESLSSVSARVMYCPRSVLLTVIVTVLSSLGSCRWIYFVIVGVNHKASCICWSIVILIVQCSMNILILGSNY